MENGKIKTPESIERGNRIKIIRLDILKLERQKDFGELFGGLGASTVSGYETGSADPGAATWVEIAKIGNVSLDWLLTGKEEKSHKPVNQKSIFPNRHMQDIAGWINEQIEPEIYWGELKAALIDRHPKFETYLKKQNRDGGEDGDHKKISTGQR